MKSTPNPLAAPRFDLRESAFRRYEKYIARAYNETIIIDPFLELGIKPDSFVCRFKDAVLGYTRYHYQSHLIPSDAVLIFRVTPLLDGTVEIIHRNNLTAAMPGSKPCLDRDAVAITLQQLAYEQMRGPVYYQNLSTADAQWLLDQRDLPTYNGNLAMKLEGNRMTVF